jgi:hypothetical protein
MWLVSGLTYPKGIYSYGALEGAKCCCQECYQVALLLLKNQAKLLLPASVCIRKYDIYTPDSLSYMIPYVLNTTTRYYPVRPYLGGACLGVPLSARSINRPEDETQIEMSWQP